jgi:hypothetical protein
MVYEYYITTTILDIIHLFFKHDVSEAGFFLCLQVELTQFGSTE